MSESTSPSSIETAATTCSTDKRIPGKLNTKFFENLAQQPSATSSAQSSTAQPSTTPRNIGKLSERTQLFNNILQQQQQTQHTPFKQPHVHPSAPTSPQGYSSNENTSNESHSRSHSNTTTSTPTHKSTLPATTSSEQQPATTTTGGSVAAFRNRFQQQVNTNDSTSNITSPSPASPRAGDNPSAATSAVAAARNRFNSGAGNATTSTPSTTNSTSLPQPLNIGRINVNFSNNNKEDATTTAAGGNSSSSSSASNYNTQPPARKVPGKLAVDLSALNNALAANKNMMFGGMMPPKLKTAASTTNEMTENNNVNEDGSSNIASPRNNAANSDADMTDAQNRKNTAISIGDDVSSLPSPSMLDKASTSTPIPQLKHATAGRAKIARRGNRAPPTKLQATFNDNAQAQEIQLPPPTASSATTVFSSTVPIDMVIHEDDRQPNIDNGAATSDQAAKSTDIEPTAEPIAWSTIHQPEAIRDTNADTPGKTEIVEVQPPAVNDIIEQHNADTDAAAPNANAPLTTQQTTSTDSRSQLPSPPAIPQISMKELEREADTVSPLHQQHQRQAPLKQAEDQVTVTAAAAQDRSDNLPQLQQQQHPYTSPLARPASSKVIEAAAPTLSLSPSGATPHRLPPVTVHTPSTQKHTRSDTFDDIDDVLNTVDVGLNGFEFEITPKHNQNATTPPPLPPSSTSNVVGATTSPSKADTGVGTGVGASRKNTNALSIENDRTTPQRHNNTTEAVSPSSNAESDREKQKQRLENILRSPQQQPNIQVPPHRRATHPDDDSKTNTDTGTTTAAEHTHSHPSHSYNYMLPRDQQTQDRKGTHPPPPPSSLPDNNYTPASIDEASNSRSQQYETIQSFETTADQSEAQSRAHHPPPLASNASPNPLRRSQREGIVKPPPPPATPPPVTLQTHTHTPPPLIHTPPAVAAAQPSYHHHTSPSASRSNGNIYSSSISQFDVEEKQQPPVSTTSSADTSRSVKHANGYYESKAEMYIMLLKAGTVMNLYERKQSAWQCSVFVQSTGFLFCADPKSRQLDHMRSVYIGYIKEIVAGKDQRFDVWKSKKTKDVPTSLAFTIVGDERELHLQAPTREARDEWIEALLYAKHNTATLTQ